MKFLAVLWIINNNGNWIIKNEKKYELKKIKINLKNNNAYR